MLCAFKHTQTNVRCQTYFIVMSKDEKVFNANEFAKNIENICALDSNIAAMLTAQLLAEGKSKCEVQKICNFLQLLTTALRTYIL